jgi:hypothetical protein
VIASADVLIERARDRAELIDLGADGWQTGLEHLLESVDRDVDDAEAVVRIESLVVDRLVLRLRIEAWYAHHGSEVTSDVEGPMVILGLPRTGTTALHYLLAVDPQFRCPRSWEIKDPVPPADGASAHDDPRRPREQPAPDVRHIATVDGPAEDWPIHALAFDHAELTLPVPSHSRWWRDSDHRALFPYHERVLRLLHTVRPPERWLLKMPAYLFLLPELAAHYPAARFLMTHRDPVTALASTCSTVAHSRRERTPSWSPDEQFGSSLLEHWADGMRQCMHARAVLGEARFIDVAQHELEVDPVATAERAYPFAGLTLPIDARAAMVDWAAGNQRGARGEHRYQPEEYGLTAERITEAFGPYLEQFGSYCSARG